MSCGDFLRAFRIVFFFDTESLPEPFLEKKLFLLNMTVGERNLTAQPLSPDSEHGDLHVRDDVRVAAFSAA
jgi:hypothetical protein